MIYIVTGTPGSSKTLNTLKLVCESPIFQGREIYYHNINELKLDWIELTADDVKRWYDLPHGSVIVVDECQSIFPQRPPSQKVPDHVSRLDQHRHGGYDFVLITQNPKKLDSMVRYLIERHIHYERSFGLESARQLTWEKCIDDPANNARRADAVEKRVPFDKKYYSLYKSAEVHTAKRQIPFKVYVPFLLLAIIIGVGWWHFHDRWAPKSDGLFSSPAPSSVPSAHVVHQSQPLTFDKASDSAQYVKTPMEYVAERTPRIHDIPASAPIYDELTKVKSFPRPQCLYFKASSRCNCFTQQATPLDISYDACVRYVERGYFDATVPDERSFEKKSDLVAKSDN